MALVHFPVLVSRTKKNLATLCVTKHFLIEITKLRTTVNNVISTNKKMLRVFLLKCWKIEQKVSNYNPFIQQYLCDKLSKW
jgi:hypothetical protein